MDLRIDLLAGEKRLSLVELEFAKKLKVVISIVLAVYLVGLAALLGYRLYLARQMAEVTLGVDKQEKLIAAKLPLESRYVLIAKKLELVNTFLQERESKRSVLNFFYELAPVGVALTDISFTDPAEEEFVLSGEAESIFSFSRFLDILDAAIDEKVFIGVELASVRRTPEGRYEFSLKVLLDVTQFKPETG